MINLDEVISCVNGYDPKALPVALAQQVMRSFVQPTTAIETVPLRAALGRVLASDAVSPFNVPNYDNSAMDGYAFNSSTLIDTLSTGLIISGKSLAGVAREQACESSECIRVMTGAVIPAGCDTVVPQEFCEVENGIVRFDRKAVNVGDNRRLAGEDLRTGSVAITAGTLLRPAHIGLLASIGMGEVTVLRKLRVAFFSTGNELYPIGEPLFDALPPGGVYDSNRYTLCAMLERLGVEPIDLGVVRDDPVLLEAAFTRAVNEADAVVTSGGVSVGEADYTKQVMAKLGRVEFWTIAMRPGRPMAFGEITCNGKRSVLFGLPGNPVAVMVTFYHFVREALQRMQGMAAAPAPVYARARASKAIRKKPGRTEYQRGTVTPATAAAGRYEVQLAGAQGSGILSSMCEANCFIVLHHGQGDVAAGDEVDVLLFEGLI